ncbi:MAG: hypothetical protein USCAAHI_01259 [Beijerinckiaceae bacterium]|nr:MAG: hypothetical protein USCAAHI_01259 [Beijerinckiaceae bacterium]
MNLVAGAVEEAGIDEKHAIGRRRDARLEIDGSAPLLVHDPNLDRVPGQPQHVLDAGEKRVGERDFVRSVHFWLHDVDRTMAAVARTRKALEIVDRDQRSDCGIQDGFGNLIARLVEHRIGFDVMADISHQQKAAPMQGHRGAIAARIGAILRKSPLNEQSVLFKGFRQAPLHQPKPVAVDGDLILRIDGCDAVLEINDGAESGFKDNVGHASLALGPDEAVLINFNFNMQAMVAQQNDKGVERFLPVSGEPARMTQPRVKPIFKDRNEFAASDFVSGNRLVAALRERNHIVQKRTDPIDDLGAPHFVVAPPTLRAFRLGNCVRAIERIVKTAPARVCGIESVARIRGGNDELGSGDPRDLQDMFGAKGKVGRFRDNIADLAEKFCIARGVKGHGPGGAMIFVDLFLQLVAKPQLVAYAWRELINKPRQPAPKLVGADIRSRQDFVVDEVAQNLRNPDFVNFLVSHHVQATQLNAQTISLTVIPRVSLIPL